MKRRNGNASRAPIYKELPYEEAWLRAGRPIRPGTRYTVRHRPEGEGVQLIDVDEDGTETFSIGEQELLCKKCKQHRAHDLFLEVGLPEGALQVIKALPRAVCRFCYCSQTGEASIVGKADAR